MSKRFAFTLIEILIVIVVIGIISSFIIVSMSSITSKATIAKSQAFSSSIKNAIMSNLVSEWRLDETGTDTTAKDSWGANNGTWSGAGGGSYTSPSWRTSSECISGGCLAFDGTDDYVNYGNVLNMTTNDFSISTWLFLTSSDWGGVVKKGSSNSGYGFYVTSGVWANCGDVGDWIIPQGSAIKLNTNKWYNVVLSWDRDAFLTAYVNGVATGTPLNISSKVNTNLTVANNFEIGRGDFGGFLYFKNKIDDVRIYNAAIPTSLIEQNYYSGINKLLVNQGINKEEYGQRINAFLALSN